MNFMNWDNPGKVLITGASAGMGAEYARQLSAQGFQPVLIARRKKKLEELASEIEKKYSIKSEIIVADLAKLSDIEKVRKYISDLDDKLDILINNAGFDIWKSFNKTPLQRHVDMINVHNNTPVQFCYTAIPGMVKKNRGVMINVSSVSGLTVMPEAHIMYTSTKVFLTVFSEMLQHYLKRKRSDIIVQCLCPFWTLTGFHDTEEMNGFDRDRFKGWMTSESVIEESLKFIRNDEVVFVPGDVNRAKQKVEKELACSTGNVFIYRKFGGV
ncbi:MAG: SDR family NAD(P)-dependent oxidoreductase [Promethearchaeota archaeon]